MTISKLIDKQDMVEHVRDQIAAILALEIQAQMVLATAAGKDEEKWDVQIFSERSNPYEKFLALDPTDVSPVANVYWDSTDFNRAASTSVARQKSDTTYHIDCFGYGRSSEATTGHTLGDREAAVEVQRAVRLVRNILMASQYTYLGMRGVVWRRWVQGTTMFQPEVAASTQKIAGARLTLQVEFNEFAPQVEPETLDTLAVTVHRQLDGRVLVKADYT